MESPVSQSISREASEAIKSACESFARQLSGRSYSPRIKLLSIDEVCEATGLAPSTIYELVNTGGFPKPQKIGRKNAWRESTLIAWLDRNDPNRDADWMKKA